MQHLVWLVLLLLASTAAAKGPHPLGHDVLGWGYDILYGNPDEKKDPGHRVPAFAFTYDQKKTTPDNAHTIPDAAYATLEPDSACSYSSPEVRLFFGQKTYQTALNHEAMASDAMHWPGRFSLSAGWKATTNHSEYRSATTSVLSTCAVYSLSLDTYHSNVSEAFSAAVIGLPTSGSPLQSSIKTFVRTFGTDYVSTVVMGSKTILDTTFAEWDYTTLENKVDVDYAARENFNSTLLGSAAGPQAKTLESLASSQTEVRFGVPIPKGSPSSVWRQRSHYNPVPLSYTMASITELMLSRYFPSLSTVELSQKSELVAEYLSKYCALTPGCAAPIPDVKPLNVSVIVKAGGRSHSPFYATCPSGMYISSCGHKEPSKKGSHEPFKRMFPSSSTSCECYDSSNTMDCYATCWSKQIPGFQIVEHTTHSGNATCPPGKKVLGCGAQLVGSKEESHPRYRPNTDGSGCYCYDYYGIRCYATCGYTSHLGDYQIVKKSGRAVTVGCEQPGTYVLGCGYAAHEGFEAYPDVYPNPDYRSCTCYNYYGVDCYAICARVL